MNKVKCKICKRKVKENGLVDHIRDVHTSPQHVKESVPQTTKIHPVERFAANLWRNPL